METIKKLWVLASILTISGILLGTFKKAMRILEMPQLRM
jgi:hypothetical protein